MIDKHINTQPAGILHRTLVETGYPLEIVIEDCETKNGISIRKDWRIPEGDFLGNAQKVPFSKRIMGRTLIKPIKIKASGKSFLARKDSTIDYDLARAIEENEQIEEVFVRSPLLCKAKDGICSRCYGHSLDTLKDQGIGTPVGLIAGHIIGERGVQLAMRTFHTGGATVSEVISTLPWIRQFFGAKDVEIPIYKVEYKKKTIDINRWLLLLFLLSKTVARLSEIENKKDKLSINDFLSQIAGDSELSNLFKGLNKQSKLWSNFLHVISFEALSIYSGDIAPVHFETLFKAMMTNNETFRGIFSQAGLQGSVLASASHDRAIQRIFKAAISNQKDLHIPWREKFIRGLI